MATVELGLLPLTLLMVRSLHNQDLSLQSKNFPTSDVLSVSLLDIKKYHINNKNHIRHDCTVEARLYENSFYPTCSILSEVESSSQHNYSHELFL